MNINLVICDEEDRGVLVTILASAGYFVRLNNCSGFYTSDVVTFQMPDIVEPKRKSTEPENAPSVTDISQKKDDWSAFCLETNNVNKKPVTLYKGRNIDDMSREELRDALDELIHTWRVKGLNG